MFEVSFPDWDRDLFIYLNSKNAGWLDPAMVLLSSYTAWILIFITVIGVMVYKNGRQGTNAALSLTLGVGVNLILNQVVKWMFMRPRPGNDGLLTEWINILEATDNSFSFFSSHSSTSICLAMFTTLYFRHKLGGILIFIWALAVAYSRIYVGKHYPLDVMVGICFGVLTGWMAYWFYIRFVAPVIRKEEQQGG